jgi:hypothetical protein
MPEPTSNGAPPSEAPSRAWTLLRHCLPWALVVGTALAIVAAFLMILASLVPQFRQLRSEIWGNPPTFGDIHVNTPKVYTRERLVNDRFRQQAWLELQLQRTEELLQSHAFAGVEGQSTRRERQDSSIAVGLGAKAPESDAQTAKGGSPTAPQGVKPERDAFLPDPIDQFRDAFAYRDDIRAELMRTQLDDRHDLQGNTLYRLDFDVAITPGDNTHASANITVQVEEDDREKERLRQYALLYADWHKALQTTINNAIRDQTQAILSTRGALDVSEQVPLQEFIARELCRTVSKIVATNQGEDVPSCEDGNPAFQRAMTGYVLAYMQVVQDDLKRASRDELVAAVKSSQHQSDLPEVLRALLSDQREVGPEASLTKEQWYALSYVAEKCRSGGDVKEGQLVKDGQFYDGKGGAFPCPYELPPLATLQGTITMLERVRLLERSKFHGPGVANSAEFIERLRCLINPDRLAISTSANRETLPEGCKDLFEALRKVAEQTSQTEDPRVRDDLKGAPKVRPAFMRRVLAEYMCAKLNGELRSWHVLHPITDFFNVRVGRCEFEECTLLLESNLRVPNDPMLKKLQNALNKVVASSRSPKKECGNEDAGIGLSERGGQLKFNDSMLGSLQTALNKDARIFAYAVTPTEMVQRLASGASTRATLHAMLRTTAPNRDTAETVLSGLRELENEIEMRYRNPIIVGYGTPLVDRDKSLKRDEPKTDEPLKTVFGWVIHPRLMPQREPGDKAYRHTARHYPLSAVISLPSWWKSLKITVCTRWVDNDTTECLKEVRGRGPSPPDPDTYYIEVPGAVREIREKLRYEVRTEPYIAFNSAYNQSNNQSLEIGRPARIILEGGRLWRGTVVMMGPQKADTIEVLPDMAGIIAEFKCVQPPPGMSGIAPPSTEKEHPAAVWVWTSEGRTAEPLSVWLHDFIPRRVGGKNGVEDKDTKDRPCFLEGGFSEKKEATPEVVLHIQQQQAPSH